MSRPVTINSALTVNLSSYSGATNITVGTGSYVPANGVNSSANTSTHARFSGTTQNASGYVYYTFDVSSIPSDATITSIACTARAARRYNSGTTQLQLINGTTLKGSPTTVTASGNNTSSAYTLTTGNWTRSELDNIALRIYSVKTSSANGSHIIRFYGATLTVNYTISRTEYEITASSEVQGSTASPASQYVLSGGSGAVRIDTSDLNEIMVEDNGDDVTDELAYIVPQAVNTFSGVPSSYDSQNSTFISAYTGSSSDGLTDENSSSRYCVYANTGNNAISKLTYNFDCSSIPANATITSVSCVAAAACYSSGQYFPTRNLQLYYGNTAKGSPTQITGNGSTSAKHNIDGGSWTRSELDNIKLVVYIQRGTDSTGTTASFSFWGATLTVNYTLPTTPYYQYTLTNVDTDHNIVIKEYQFVPPEEDPQKTYYSLTISSINATTTPSKGTTRVESGDSETIIIYPSDPLLTLTTDNGVDISNQLNYHAGTQPTYSVATAPNASYGFNLNTSTGYYTSTNAGVSNSASVCRVTFNLPINCLITISYINYAEATYDYGIFGNVDSALNTGYTSDTNAKLVCSTNAYNVSTVQTLTYEISSGSHFIDIKYRKDQATDSYNDSLQWKLSIEPLEPVSDAYYEYSLPNINQNHSLIFIFGDVSYYFITTSVNGDGKTYPDGQVVALPGENYRITVVPDDTAATVTMTDNGNDVTNNLEYKEVEVVKQGVTSTTVNYIYIVNNVQTAHTITAIIGSSQGTGVYIKQNGSWVELARVYKKENNVWVEQSDFEGLFEDGTVYMDGGYSEGH